MKTRFCVNRRTAYSIFINKKLVKGRGKEFWGNREAGFQEADVFVFQNSSCVLEEREPKFFSCKAEVLASNKATNDVGGRSFATPVIQSEQGEQLALDFASLHILEDGSGLQHLAQHVKTGFIPGFFALGL